MSKRNLSGGGFGAAKRPKVAGTDLCRRLCNEADCGEAYGDLCALGTHEDAHENIHLRATPDGQYYVVVPWGVDYLDPQRKGWVLGPFSDFSRASIEAVDKAFQEKLEQPVEDALINIALGSLQDLEMLRRVLEGYIEYQFTQRDDTVVVELNLSDMFLNKNALCVDANHVYLFSFVVALLHKKGWYNKPEIKAIADKIESQSELSTKKWSNSKLRPEDVDVIMGASDPAPNDPLAGKLYVQHLAPDRVMVVIRA
jgi:hypothetical protein